MTPLTCNQMKRMVTLNKSTIFTFFLIVKTHVKDTFGIILVLNSTKGRFEIFERGRLTFSTFKINGYIGGVHKARKTTVATGCRNVASKQIS